MFNLKEVNWENLGFFRFKEFGTRDYLLTNDVGEYIIISRNDFRKFLRGDLKVDDPQYKILQEQGLIKSKIDVPSLANKYQKKNLFIFQGPTLHIIVVTLRCDHKCAYCQSSSRQETDKGFDLDVATAKKIVDTIFYSPAKSIAIEFQGGEPLLNWPVVKFIVEYSKEMNKVHQKDLELRLVSNLSLIDENKLSFFVENNVTICTSLDGPEYIHNKNRVRFKGNSYKHTVKWLKRAKKVYSTKTRNKFRPGAIVTITKSSLQYPEDIVDEYIKQGINSIFIRPLTPLGMAKHLWDKIGYSAEDYLIFYKKALMHLISYALKNQRSRFHENTAKIFLGKILTEYDPNFLELRSPCGAGIGQLLYNYDGKVYTCDEGRMVEDEIFCIGDVRKSSFNKIVSHPTVRVLSIASCLDNTACDLCVYKPYCGVCPIYNWSESGNVFMRYSCNQRCLINKGILDFLFDQLQNVKVRALFHKWASYTLPD